MTEFFSSKSAWGGARANSGGPRANAGGARPGAGRKPKAEVSLQPRRSQWGEPAWYCVRTTYGGERLASEEIGIAGWDQFAPTIWKPAVASRRDSYGIIRPARPPRVEPMFPRYQFVRFALSDAWQAIRRLPGVECILGSTPERPASVHETTIERLQAVCEPNGCQYPRGVQLGSLTAPIPFAPGTTVRLLAGPMAELTGICQWSSAKRTRFLLHLLGRDVELEASTEAFEAA